MIYRVLIILLVLTLVSAVEITFDEDRYIVAYFPNNTIYSFHADHVMLNNRGNFELDFDLDNGELTIEYLNGKNITFGKSFPVDQKENEEYTWCTEYSCNNVPVSDQGCNCGGTSNCCFDATIGEWYLCASNTICCNVWASGKYQYGCSVGGKCSICVWA